MSSTIATTELQNEFKELLNDPLNKRIILSGIFGIGKSTFIRTFFEEHNQNFECIKLFPVNYSIATNEDIFELIKYDILYELLQKNPKYRKVDVRWFDALYFVSVDDIKDAVGRFVSLIPKVGKSIVDIANALTKTVKVFEQKKAKLAQNDLDDIMRFAKRVEGNPGGIYENDFYTRLIESLITSLKVDESGNHRKVVLVIDDLDRIDPEHIFRILNVFAAHFDHNSAENKFGIDKVILSCDIENVRKIFHNKYGTDVDFNGYVDKFFSKGIFYFNNRSNIVKAIPSILGTIESLHSNFLFVDARHYLRILMIKLLNSFVVSGSVNLRMIMKFLNAKYDSTPRRVTTLNEDSRFTIRNFRIMLLLEFLIDLFGSVESLVTALEGIDFELSLNEHEEKLMMGDLLYLSSWSGKVYDRFSERFQERVIDADISISVGYETLPDGTNIFFAVYRAADDKRIAPARQKEILLDAVRTYKLITM